MAKATRKKKVRRTKKASAPKKEGGAKKPTITALVIATFESNDPEISNADLTKLVQRKFPDRAFDQKHASWYRNRFKDKKLPGQKGYVGSDRKVGASKKKVSKKKTAKKTTKKKKKVRRKAKTG